MHVLPKCVNQDPGHHVGGEGHSYESLAWMYFANLSDAVGSLSFRVY